MSFRIVLIAWTVLAFTACRGNTRQERHVPTGPLARILVDSAGGVHLDGHLIPLATLRDSLRPVQSAGGAVIYTRTPAVPEPTAAQDPVVSSVLQTIIDLRLPVRIVPPDSLNLPDALLRG